MIDMKPYIKNLREFTPIAGVLGFKLNKNKLYKIYDYGLGMGCEKDVTVLIDITTGRISFEAYDENVRIELTRFDIDYYIKDFDYMVEWRLEILTKQKINNKEKIWKIKKL